MKYIYLTVELNDYDFLFIHKKREIKKKLFSRIASSFVDLTVGALSNPLEKRVSLEKLELLHNR